MAPVSLPFGGRSFTCVRLAEANFKDLAAIYIILSVGEDRKYTVIDVGQSGELGTRIDSHDRMDYWKRNCPTGNIWVCAYPMPTDTYSKDDRLKFEQALRHEYNPHCGDR